MSRKARRGTIRKILVANRGEIAVRIMRTCRDLGIKTVAIYSDPDRVAMHVEHADEAYPLNGTKASETYLDQSKVLRIAKDASVDAIHPGYGFLSENETFAAAVEAAGIRFIGPPANAIRLLGDKTAARALAKKLGYPTVAGTDALADEKAGAAAAGSIGFPILLKAAAGGGGKGMRVVRKQEDFLSAFRMAQSEASNAFGDSRVFIEQYVDAPHHVEIQILADAHGNAVHLGERDCSIQRRHQKVIEESPSPLVTPELRAEMGEAAVGLVKEAGYVNAGTVEFLVDRSRRFFFLEVNTRLQVEHPVTEVLTGLDLVQEQILIAQGDKLRVNQRNVQLKGHAIECRIYAEDPDNNFFPSTGRLGQFSLPSGPHVRVDSGARAGDTVSIHYDPMLAKLITRGSTREESIAAMQRALREFTVTGVKTTIPFCSSVLAHESFVEGNHSTQFIDKYFQLPDFSELEQSELEAAGLAAVLLSLRRPPEEGRPAETGKSQWKQRREETYRG